MKHLVSVIIPSYNHSKYLDQRIQSVLNQTYASFEVIILDDLSTDDSRTIIEKYRDNPRISHIIYNSQNSGSPFKQWNRGVEFAKGDLIWIAESDDTSNRNFLLKLVPYMEQEDVSIAYCQSKAINSEGQIMGTWKSWTDQLDDKLFETEFLMGGLDYIKTFLVYKNTIPNCSAVLFRKKVYQTSGFADETIEFCSDWLTWLKMLSNYQIAYVPEHLNSFRSHSQSVIANAITNSEANTFIPIYEKLMRIKYKESLQEMDSKTNQLIASIKKKNNLAIQNIRGNEGLHQLSTKNWLSGWKNVLFTAFSHPVNIILILRAVKISLQTITDYRSRVK